jgi:hypothetical protein
MSEPCEPKPATHDRYRLRRTQPEVACSKAGQSVALRSYEARPRQGVANAVAL